MIFEKFGTRRGRDDIPSSMFVIISWMSFLIPPTANPDRVGLLITILLVLVNIFNSVAATTPIDAEGLGLSSITMWLLGTIFFVFGALVCYVILLIKMHFNEVDTEPEDRLAKVRDII